MIFILPRRGATAWEWQIGRLWGRVMLPSFWRSHFPWHLVGFYWDSRERKEDQ